VQEGLGAGGTKIFESRDFYITCKHGMLQSIHGPSSSSSIPMDHEQLVDLARIDTRLTTIEENQQKFCNTLHQHVQWQEQTKQTLADIRQHQQQEQNNWDWLFNGLNIGHLSPAQ
jgi:hypothetical protein